MDELSGLLRDVDRPRARDQRPSGRAARRRPAPSDRARDPALRAPRVSSTAHGGSSTRARRDRGGAGTGRRVDRRARAAADPRRVGHDDHRRRRDRRRLRARARAGDPARRARAARRARGAARCSRLASLGCARRRLARGCCSSSARCRPPAAPRRCSTAFEVLDAGESRAGRRLWLGAALIGTAAGPAIGGVLTEALRLARDLRRPGPAAPRRRRVARRRRGGARGAAPLRSGVARDAGARPADGGAALPPATRRQRRRAGRAAPRDAAAPPRRGRRPPPATSRRHAPRLPPASLPLAALAFTAAAFTAVLFLLVIELVAGFAISPLRAALGVTVLPLAALGGAPRSPAPRGARALAGRGAAAPAARPRSRSCPRRRSRGRSCRRSSPAPGMGLALPALSAPSATVARGRAQPRRAPRRDRARARDPRPGRHRAARERDRPGDPAGRGARARRADRPAAEARARARAARRRRRRQPARRRCADAVDGPARRVRRRRRGLRPARRAGSTTSSWSPSRTRSGPPT